MSIGTELQPIRLALITPSAAVREVVRNTIRAPGYALGLEVAASFNEIGKEQLARLRKYQPEAMILDLEQDPAVGIRFAQFLAEEDPELRIVAIGPALSPEFLLEAMRAGITEVLPAPAGEPELQAALERVARKLRRGGDEERDPGRIYSLFSAKGGTGNTTIATNLAVELHRLTGKRTLLVDLDLELGETAVLLGVQPRFNFIDMVKNFHRMDANLLASYIERHESGVELLSAPIQPERVETPPREEVRAVLNFLRQHYDFIVVDTSQSFSPSTVAALEAADHVLLVTTPDLPALRNAKRCLPLLQRYGNGKEGGIQLLVNRYAQENAISLEDISRTLDLAISWSLSSDYHAISEAVNKGEPVVLDGRSRYARDLRKMGAELVGLRDAESGRSAGPLAGITAPLRGAWLRFFPTSSSS